MISARKQSKSRQPSPTRSVSKIQKSKSLEFFPSSGHSKGVRPITNVWDVMEKQPEVVKKLLAAKQKRKPERAEKESKFLSTHKALKAVVERKEKLSKILNDLETATLATKKKTDKNIKAKVAPKKKTKKKQLVLKNHVPAMLSPKHFTKPFEQLVSKLEKENHSIFGVKNEGESVDRKLAKENFISVFNEPIRSQPEPSKMNLQLSNPLDSIPTPALQMLHIEDQSKDIPTMDSKTPEIAKVIPNFEKKIETKIDSTKNMNSILSSPVIHFESCLPILETPSPQKLRNENVKNVGEIEDSTVQLIKLFQQNLNISPNLIRQFVSTVPSDGEGGLSLGNQGDIIHYGARFQKQLICRLESKILDMMKMYNDFISQLSKIFVTKMM